MASEIKNKIHSCNKKLFSCVQFVNRGVRVIPCRKFTEDHNLQTAGKDHDLYRGIGDDLPPETFHLRPRAVNGRPMLASHASNVINVH